MALNITENARARSQQTILQPSLVMEIDGVSTIFGAQIIKKYILIGDEDLDIGDAWVIGGFNEVEDQSDIISLDGSTTSIKQQLLQDKGGTGSVSSMQIALIDKDGEATDLISPGVVVDDIIGRKARIWLSFNDTAYPEDYSIIFQGVIDEITADAQIILNVSSPEQKKRQEIFTQIQTSLETAIDNSVTTIPLVDVDGLLLPADGNTLRTYVRIEDEIIQYTGIDTGTNELTGCTRGALGTVAAAHDDEEEVESFYRLTGQGIELALKLLLSGLDGPWVEDLPIASFVRLDPTTDVTDAVLFSEDIRVKYGVAVGDKITTTGATDGANNVSEATISSIVEFESGLALILEGAGLVIETDTAAVAAFRSQYDVLGHGVGMGGDEVDVEEFQRVSDFFSASIPNFDFYLRESQNAKELIDTQILFPSACYSIPRKGRVSVGFTSPPVAIADIPALTSREVVAPQKTQIKRSVGKFFYNTIVYRFEEDVLDAGRYLAGRVTIDADSRARIPLGGKPLTITAKGLRADNDTIAILNQNALRILERYKFAAETVKCQVQYGVGYTVEVGDVVLYGDENLLLPDTKFGTREFKPRLMEVFNKTLNIKTGQVDLELVDTNYLTNGRYGIFAPASVLAGGNTTTLINVTDSFGFDEDKIEADKWRPYVGERVLIHDDNWTYEYETRIVSISNSNPYQFTIEPVPLAPGAGAILELVQYSSSTDPEVDQLLKTLHCFMTARVVITAGVSGTEFTVDAGDIGKFHVGDPVLVHSTDFQVAAEETIVEAIVGNNVQVRDDLGFTPSAGQEVDLIGFPDEGSPYRYL